MNGARTRTLNPILLGCVLLLPLAGCVSKDKSDLEKYVEDVLARKGGQIQPLPPIKPYERYIYQSAEKGLRDPFQSFLNEEPKKETVEAPANESQKRFIDEMQTHNAEELESFELDSLRMVGILQNNDEMWGIVRDNSGTVHRVQVGNYVGRNFGKITNIQEDKIELREIIKTPQGNYEERQATLALSEQ
jgi:type IV pilus assembly protein PilP